MSKSMCHSKSSHFKSTRKTQRPTHYGPIKTTQLFIWGTTHLEKSFTENISISLYTYVHFLHNKLLISSVYLGEGGMFCSLPLRLNPRCAENDLLTFLGLSRFLNPGRSES